MKLSNINDKIFYIIISPIFISLIITSIIIYSLPSFPVYDINLVDSFKVEKHNGISQFNDLDSDGESEYIVVYLNIIGNQALKITKQDGSIVNQWNFNGSMPEMPNSFFIGDYNSNGFKEIYIFSYRNDSVFLNIIEPLLKNGIDKRDIYIDKIADYNKSKDFQIYPGKLFDLNHDGIKDYIFNFYAGFAIQPRKLYSYDIINNKILKSPKAGVSIYRLKIFDIDNDSQFEIIGYTSAQGNITKQMDIPYRDSSSYIMVLNENLEFEFEPMEYAAYPSVTNVFPIASAKDTFLISLSVNRGISDMENTLAIYNTKGKKIKDTLVKSKSKYKLNIFALDNSIINEKLFIQIDDSIFNVDYDLNINYVGDIYFPMNAIKRIDIDEDGKFEYLNFCTINEYQIVAQDFSTFTSFNIAYSEPVYCRTVSLIETKGGKKLFIQTGAICNIIDYSVNPYHSFLWLIYIGIFLATLILFYLLRFSFQLQLVKKERIGKQISELQFKAINNQLNPHFILNAMNSVISSIYKENKEEAYGFGVKFSNLMREVLLSSDKISRSLEKEIEFIRIYLDLEKYRFKDVFDYQINVNETVDRELAVPKMIIHIFAENAVKHGLTCLDKDGLVKIDINQTYTALIINIEDNGIGRLEAGKNNTNGTGKGLQIVKQIIVLYEKLNQKKISYHIEDMQPHGTKVVVEMEI